VTNGIPLGCSLLLPVCTVNCVQTLKVNTLLATGKSTAWVSATAAFIEDFAGNNVVVTNAGAAKNANFFGEFNEASLVAFKLDLTAETLEITFSSAIDTDEFDAKFITIQSTQTSDATSVKLTTASKTTDADAYVFTVNLCRIDMDALKEVRTLATSITDTWMSLTTDVARDVQGRPVLVTETISAKQAASYTADRTAPTLEAMTFSLDGAGGELYLSFSELVDVDTVDVTCITIQDAAPPTTGTGTVTLTSGSTVAELDTSSFITITFSEADLNAMKHIDDFVRCAFFDRNLHSRMPLVPTPARLKLLQACDQWHSSRLSTFLTGSHCKFRPNTKGRVCSHHLRLHRSVLDR
jgi:hypothetical protein